MKKSVLALFLLSALWSRSQITITNADMPSAGDTLRVSYSNDTIDPTLTDTNYTWNYAFLIPTSQWVEKFDNPSTFPFPFNLLFNIGNTSYGQQQYTPDSIPGLGIAMDDAYGFFKKSTTTLKQNGLGLTINAIPIPFQYNPQDVIYNFPLNYGDKDSCDSEFGPPTVIPLPFYYGQKIHRVNEVDGWGTLITPYGTFSSIRVKSLITIRDTFADSSGMGFAFTRPLQYEFKWLKTGGKIPYLQINAVDAAGIPVITQMSYRDSMRTGVVQIGINELSSTGFPFTVYPNPAGSYFVAEFDLKSKTQVVLELYTADGKKVFSLNRGQQSPGKQMQIIRASDHGLTSGIYFLRIRAGDQEGIRKVMIR